MGLSDQPINWKKSVRRGLANLRGEPDGGFRLLLGGLSRRNLGRMDNARALSAERGMLLTNWSYFVCYFSVSKKVVYRYCTLCPRGYERIPASHWHSMGGHVLPYRVVRLSFLCLCAALALALAVGARLFSIYCTMDAVIACGGSLFRKRCVFSAYSLGMSEAR